MSLSDKTPYDSTLLYHALQSISSMNDQLRNWLDLLSPLELEISQRLASAPSGTLRISRHKNKVQYYRRSSKSEIRGTYISKAQTELITGLAQKLYDQKLLKLLHQEIQAINAYLHSCTSESLIQLYEQLTSDKQDLIMPLIETESDFRRNWENTAYSGKPFPEDYPVYLTGKEERVRSKSEVIIADALTRAGVPYRYEFPLRLKGIGTIYPDFTVLNLRLRKEYYWEHFGMMDDAEYAGKAIQKLSAYLSNDYYPGEHLIITSEAKDYPVNTRHIKKIIEHYFL